MKKIWNIMGLFLVTFLLAGCMDVKTVMKINADKSLDVNMTMELDLIKYTKTTFAFDPDKQNLTDKEIKEYLNKEMNSEGFNMDEFMDNEQKKEMEKEGYKVETKLDKENYIYQINLTKHFNNINEASMTEEESKEANEETNREVPTKFFIKTSNNTYKFYIDNNEVETQGPDQDLNDSISGIIGSVSGITYRYEITLPNKPISNNATKVSEDGKNLIWELNANNSNEIEFEFAFASLNENPSTIPTEPKTNAFDIMEYLTDKDILIGGSLIIGGILTIIISSVIYIKSAKKNN